MKMDVIGRARNVQLPVSKPLLPLFEAIMNSIQAIEDAKEKNGKIIIEILRDSNTLLSEDHSIADITGFIIKDNGIGFDEKNYEAFLTSDTTYKAKRGGRGIGRFLWLTAFEKVEIDSIFEEKGVQKLRKFKFCLSSKGIEDDSCISVNAMPRETIVRLIGYKSMYAHNCRKRLDSIATLIVEQFLDVFISGSCPKVMLTDKLAGESVDLDQFYDKEMMANTETHNIIIKEKKFALIFVRIYSTHINDHKVNLCANDRVVISEKLSGIPNLTKRFRDIEGKEFVCALYVNSPVLDAAVNQERTDFNLLKDNENLFENDISMADIWPAIREACKNYLKPYTASIAKKKRDRIEEFVAADGIMYRPILKYLDNKIDEIAPDANNNEIDRYLYDGYHELQTKLRADGQMLLKDENADQQENNEQYKERFEQYCEQITEINSADLARYVCHRKSIIELLKKQLNAKANGKYAPEEKIHNIIFPRGKTSDDIMFEEHNLWLIDERLAFHVFLSSDKQIKKSKLLTNDSKKEPDILVFEKAIAFSETTSVPFNSIIIIEFKKPVRNEYSATENPFVQIFDYIRDIKAGKAKSHDGRPVTVPVNLPFYCYIVCDLTPKLKEWAENHGFKPTPDSLGYFAHNPNYNAYVEVLSYGKVVADAEKRNKAFFNKIGI